MSPTGFATMPQGKFKLAPAQSVGYLGR